MTPTGGEDAGSSAAAAEVRRRIARIGPLSFAEFMELALYGDDGYYNRAAFTTGPEGDFYTAPDTGPVFGRLLSRQVAEIWERLERPADFEIVEAGPGRGLLAGDLLRGLAEEAPELHDRVVLTLDEPCPTSRRAQRERLAEHLPASRLRFEEERVTARAPDSWTGVLVANELLDALPVHRVVRRRGRLREVLVGADEHGGFREVLAEPPEDVAAYAARYRAAVPEGGKAEAGLAARRWVLDAGRSLHRGAMLLVDYGDDADHLARREGGTIVAYSGHRTSDDLYARVGRQDLTAQVDWSAVDDAASDAGLERLGRTTQDRFLLSLGIAEWLVATVDGREDPASLRRRMALRALVLPQAMGRRFQVAVYGRGVVGPLRGFADPLAERPG